MGNRYKQMCDPATADASMMRTDAGQHPINKLKNRFQVLLDSSRTASGSSQHAAQAPCAGRVLACRALFVCACLLRACCVLAVNLLCASGMPAAC